MSINGLSSGISDIILAGIKIYPNPSSGIYYVENSTPIKDITIYDIMEKIVLENNMIYNNSIVLSSQPNGHIHAPPE